MSCTSVFWAAWHIVIHAQFYQCNQILHQQHTEEIHNQQCNKKMQLQRPAWKHALTYVAMHKLELCTQHRTVVSCLVDKSLSKQISPQNELVHYYLLYTVFLLMRNFLMKIWPEFYAFANKWCCLYNAVYTPVLEMQLKIITQRNEKKNEDGVIYVFVTHTDQEYHGLAQMYFSNSYIIAHFHLWCY